MEITTLGPTSLDVVKKKRVAAYIRVSSDKNEAENSLEAQLYYFQEKISQTAGWTLAGYYVDEGVSGTKEDRPGFTRMMTAVRNGEVDLIVTKSITRFARNTAFLLSTIRELKRLGVDVIFDNDHLSLMSANGELLISLLAMHAEEQSRSASENKRWQIRRDFENGRPTFCRTYGYKWADGMMEIVPEEAAIVRRIFAAYLSGQGTGRIAKDLNQDRIPSRDGKKWGASTIHGVLRNEKYVGDLLLQKYYVPDFRTKKKYRNKGELRQVLVSSAHEAIVDRTTFEATKTEILRRQGQHPELSHQPVDEGLFTGLIVCGHCGRHFIRKRTSSKAPLPIWKCSNAVLNGREICHAKQIRESVLIDKTREALNLPEDTELTRDLITHKITAIESAAVSRLRFILADGTIKELTWQNPSRKESWTEEMKATARRRALEQHARKEKK